MSLRAELIRFCLPWFMRPRSRADIQIEDVRRQAAGFAHLVPPPPRGTELIVVDAGGVKAERIATPRSLLNRYVLHLHGGAYLLGFPALFRDFTWRIADAAGARVLCLDYRLAPEHPFPAAIEDVIAAYRWLISECAEPRHVAFIGDSSVAYVRAHLARRACGNRAPRRLLAKQTMTALSRKLGRDGVRPRFRILHKRSCNRFPLRNRVEAKQVAKAERLVRSSKRDID